MKAKCADMDDMEERGIEASSNIMDEEDAKREACLTVIESLLEWIFPPNASTKHVMFRVYVLAWFLRRDWLGPNMTQAKLAEHLGVSRHRLNEIVTLFRDSFGGLMTAGMRSDQARGHMRRPHSPPRKESFSGQRPKAG
jgi:hypothetical protein